MEAGSLAWLRKQGRDDLPCCSLLLIAVQLSRFAARPAFPLSLTARRGYRGFSGLPFSPRLRFFRRRKGGLPAFAGRKNDGRKCFADPQAPSGRRGCLRPEPLLSSVPIPLPRSIPASPALGPVLAFLVGTPAVAGAMSMRLKQTGAMINHQIIHSNLLRRLLPAPSIALHLPGGTVPMG